MLLFLYFLTFYVSNLTVYFLFQIFLLITFFYSFFKQFFFLFENFESVLCVCFWTEPDDEKFSPNGFPVFPGFSLVKEHVVPSAKLNENWNQNRRGDSELAMNEARKRGERRRQETAGRSGGRQVFRFRFSVSRPPEHRFIACEMCRGALGNSHGARNFPCDAANERRRIWRFGCWPHLISGPKLRGVSAEREREHFFLGQNVGLPVAWQLRRAASWEIAMDWACHWIGFLGVGVGTEALIIPLSGCQKKYKKCIFERAPSSFQIPAPCSCCQ